MGILGLLRWYSNRICERIPRPTQVLLLLYIACNAFIMQGPTPILFNTCHTVERGSVSKAFLKCMKQVYSFVFYAFGVGWSVGVFDL